MRPFFSATVLLALSGCSDVGSGSLLTSGMSAVIRGISDDGESTEVRTTLRAGGMTSTTYVKLENDDALTVEVDDEDYALIETSLGPLTSYHAVVPTADPALIFTVALSRTLDDGAPASTFQLPESFELTTDAEGIDPTQDVQISWEPSGTSYSLVLEVSGECVRGGTSSLTGDDGVATIPAAHLERFGETPGVSCPVDVKLSKQHGGELDAAYGRGGLVQGIQRRALSFTIAFD